MADSVYDLEPDDVPSIAVVTAVADVMDESPLELEPLHSTIDPEALDGVFECPDGTESRVLATFEYCGCEVSVTSARITVDSGA